NGAVPPCHLAAARQPIHLLLKTNHVSEYCRHSFRDQRCGLRSVRARIPASRPYPLFQGENMRTKSILMALVVCFVVATIALAADPFIGTWKLNAAKSKVSSSGPNNTTVVYEAAGDSVKITTDGTDAQGKPAHSDWTGKFDGKDYPVSGDPNADA